jgi:hypothetical protein
MDGEHLQKLDSQDVKCEKGEALASFQVTRQGCSDQKHMRYKFQCVKLGECNLQCYLNNYPDLQKTLGKTNLPAAAKHYSETGRLEGRDCSCPAATCNWECYLDRYADLQRAFGSKLSSSNKATVEEHYKNHGKAEGRDCTCRATGTTAVSQEDVLLDAWVRPKGVTQKKRPALSNKPNSYVPSYEEWKHATSSARGNVKSHLDKGDSRLEEALKAVGPAPAPVVTEGDLIELKVEDPEHFSGHVMPPQRSSLPEQPAMVKTDSHPEEQTAKAPVLTHPAQTAERTVLAKQHSSSLMFMPGKKAAPKISHHLHAGSKHVEPVKFKMAASSPRDLPKSELLVAGEETNSNVAANTKTDKGELPGKVTVSNETAHRLKTKLKDTPLPKTDFPDMAGLKKEIKERKETQKSWADHLADCEDCDHECNAKLQPGAGLMDISTSAAANVPLPSISSLMALLHESNFSIISSGYAGVVQPAARLTVDAPTEIYPENGIPQENDVSTKDGPRTGAMKMAAKIAAHAPEELGELLSMLGGSSVDVDTIAENAGIDWTSKISDVKVSHPGHGKVKVTATVPQTGANLVIMYEVLMEIDYAMAKRLCGYASEITGSKLELKADLKHSHLTGDAEITVRHKSSDNFAVTGTFIPEKDATLGAPSALLTLPSNMTLHAECGRKPRAGYDNKFARARASQPKDQSVICDPTVKFFGAAEYKSSATEVEIPAGEIEMMLTATGFHARITGQAKVASSIYESETTLSQEVAAADVLVSTELAVVSPLALANLTVAKSMADKYEKHLPTLRANRFGKPSYVTLTNAISSTSDATSYEILIGEDAIGEVELLEGEQKLKGLVTGHFMHSDWTIEVKSRSNGLQVEVKPAEFQAGTTVFWMGKDTFPSAVGSGYLKVARVKNLNVDYKIDMSNGFRMLMHGSGELDNLGWVHAYLIAEDGGDGLALLRFRNSTNLQGMPLASGVDDLPHFAPGGYVAFISASKSAQAVLGTSAATAHQLIDPKFGERKEANEILHGFVGKISVPNGPLSGVLLKGELMHGGKFSGSMEKLNPFLAETPAKTAHFAGVGVIGYIDLQTEALKLQLEDRGSVHFKSGIIGELKSNELSVVVEARKGRFKKMSMVGRGFAVVKPLRQSNAVTQQHTVLMEIAGSMDQEGNVLLKANGTMVLESDAAKLYMTINHTPGALIKANVVISAPQVALTELIHAPASVNVVFLKQVTAVYSTHDIPVKDGTLRAGLTVTGKIGNEKGDHLLGPLRASFKVTDGEQKGAGSLFEGWFPISGGDKLVKDMAINAVLQQTFTKRVCDPMVGEPLEVAVACKDRPMAELVLNGLTSKTWMVNGDLTRTFHAGGGSLRTPAMDGPLTDVFIRFLARGWIMEGMQRVDTGYSVPVKIAHGVHRTAKSWIKMPGKLENAAAAGSSIQKIVAQGAQAAEEVQTAEEKEKVRLQNQACTFSEAQLRAVESVEDEVVRGNTLGSLKATAAANCRHKVKLPATMSLMQMADAINAVDAPVGTGVPPAVVNQADNAAAQDSIVTEQSAPEQQVHDAAVAAANETFFGSKSDAQSFNGKLVVPNVGADAVFIMIGPIKDLAGLKQFNNHAKFASQLAGVTDGNVIVTNIPQKLSGAEQFKLLIPSPHVKKGVTIIATAALKKGSTLKSLIGAYGLPNHESGRAAMRFTDAGVKAEFYAQAAESVVFSDKDIEKKIGKIEMTAGKVVVTTPKEASAASTAFASGNLVLHEGGLGERFEFPAAEVKLTSGGFRIIAQTLHPNIDVVQRQPAKLASGTGALPPGKTINDVRANPVPAEETSAIKSMIESNSVKARLGAPRSVLLIVEQKNNNPARCVLRMGIPDGVGVDRVFKKNLRRLQLDQAANDLTELFKDVSSIPGIYKPFENEDKVALERSNVMLEAAVLRNVSMKVDMPGYSHLVATEGVTMTVHPPISPALKSLGVPLSLGKQRVPTVFKAPWSEVLESEVAGEFPLELTLDATSLKDNTADGLKLGHEWKVRGLHIRVAEIPNTKRLATLVDGELQYKVSPGTLDDTSEAGIHVPKDAKAAAGEIVTAQTQVVREKTEHEHQETSVLRPPVLKPTRTSMHEAKVEKRPTRVLLGGSSLVEEGAAETSLLEVTPVAKDNVKREEEIIPESELISTGGDEEFEPIITEIQGKATLQQEPTSGKPGIALPAEDGEWEPVDTLAEDDDNTPETHLEQTEQLWGSWHRHHRHRPHRHHRHRPHRHHRHHSHHRHHQHHQHHRHHRHHVHKPHRYTTKLEVAENRQRYLSEPPPPPPASIIYISGTVSGARNVDVTMSVVASDDKKKPGEWHNALGQPNLHLTDTRLDFHLDGKTTRTCPGLCGLNKVTVSAKADLTFQYGKRVQNVLNGVLEVESPSKSKFFIGEGDLVFPVVTRWPKAISRLYLAYPIDAPAMLKFEQEAIVKRGVFPDAAKANTTFEAIADLGPDLRSLPFWKISSFSPTDMMDLPRDAYYKEKGCEANCVKPFHIRNVFHFLGEEYKAALYFRQDQVANARVGTYSMRTAQAEPSVCPTGMHLHTGKGYTQSTAQKYCDSRATCKSFMLHTAAEGYAWFCAGEYGAAPQSTITTKDFQVGTRTSATSSLLSEADVGETARLGFNLAFRNLLMNSYAEMGDVFGFVVNSTIDHAIRAEATINLKMLPTVKGKKLVVDKAVDNALFIAAYHAGQMRKNATYPYTFGPVLATNANMGDGDDIKQKLLPGSIVALKGSKGGYCALKDKNVVCDQQTVGIDAKFEVIDAGFGLTILKGSNQLYCEDKGSSITCNKPTYSFTEKFREVAAGDDKIALKGGKDNRFCRDAGDAIECDKEDVGAEEKFEVECLSKCTMADPVKLAMEDHVNKMMMDYDTMNDQIVRNICNKIPGLVSEATKFKITDPLLLNALERCKKGSVGGDVTAMAAADPTSPDLKAQDDIASGKSLSRYMSPETTKYWKRDQEEGKKRAICYHHALP